MYDSLDNKRCLLNKMAEGHSRGMLSRNNKIKNKKVKIKIRGEGNNFFYHRGLVVVVTNVIFGGVYIKDYTS